MSTVRVVIAEAMRALRALAPGDDPTADDLIVGLEAVQNLVLDIHEARGPLLDVDVTVSLVPSENQRIRVQAGFDVAVTLPNSIPMYDGFDPYDYGFDPATSGDQYAPQGATGAADGIYYRQPRDGARVEIVGTTQGLYFYRADINQWMPATGLTVDTELPFNDRYRSAIGAILAERLMDVVATGQMTPALTRRIARGNAALMIRTGVHHPPTRAQYF
jgi:hypothetical protein